MDEDKIINLRFGEVSDQPSSPDDKRIGVTREGHPVYERKDGTRYQVYPVAETSVYTAKYNPNNTDWWNTGNIATDENGRRFYGNTPEEAQQKCEAWKQQKLQEQGAWSTIDMINAMTGGIVNQLSPTQFSRNIYNMATGNPDFSKQFVFGNNGLVPDEWAAKHPGWAAALNAGTDIAILGGPSLWRATGRLAANTGRGVATAVKNTPRMVRNIPENMRRVVDNAKNWIDYRNRILQLNSRGKLNSGFPIQDLALTEETANKALDNITKALQTGQAVNSSDARIVRKFFNMSDDELMDFIKDQSVVQKSKLLDRLYTGQNLDLADMESILVDEQLQRVLPPEVRQAIANEFDDALYKSVQTADDQVQAAKNALARRQTDRYYDELNGIANPTEKTAVPPTEGSATQAAAAPGGVPPTESVEATVNKVKPLAQRFKDQYNKVLLHYGKGTPIEEEIALLYDDAGNLIEDAVGAGGTRVPLVKSAEQVTTTTQMMPQYVNQHLIDRIYPKSLYKVSNNAVDWSPKGIRKWIYKMPENMNTQMRHVGDDLYLYGPKATLRPWVKTGMGLGAVSGAGVGVPTLWGLGKSLVSGDSTSERPVIHLFDGRNLYFDQGTVNSDTTAFLPYGGYEWIPIGKMRDGNYGQMHEEAALTQDTQEAMNAAKQNNSIGKVSIQRSNNDSIPINQ